MGIKECRLAAGLSQEEAAAALGVKQPNISAWESGRWLPKTPRLIKVAQLYGCTVDELLESEKKVAE